MLQAYLDIWDGYLAVLDQNIHIRGITWSSLYRCFGIDVGGREFQQAIGKHSMDSSRPNDSSSETPNPVHQQPELKTKTIQKTETWCHLADALDSKPWINLSTRAIKRSFSPIYFFQRLLWILEKDSVDGDHAGFMQTHGQLFRDHFQLCIEDVFNQQWVE